MESEIIKSKLAYYSNGYKTAAFEHRYHSHLTISNFGREFVIAIIDHRSGSRQLYPSSRRVRGILESRNNIPVRDIYHCRIVEIYEVLNDDLKKVGSRTPDKATSVRVWGNSYTEIEDDNCYENIDSVEINEGDEGCVFNVIVACKAGNKRALSIKQYLN